MQKKLIFLLLLAFTPGMLGVAHSAPIQLGAADPSFWSVLALGGELRIEGDAGTVVGNVGVGAPGEFRLQKATIDGSLYLQTGATSIIDPNNGTITGSIFGPGDSVADSLITQAKNDALFYSNYYNSLTPTLTIDSITGTTTLVGNAGLNVIDLTTLDLNPGVLTLDIAGGADASFIFNVSGSFKLAHSQIVFADGSGLTPDEVLFNLVGDPTGDVVLHKADTIFNGILLVPDRDFVDMLDSGLQFNGTLIGSNFGFSDNNTFRIHSGAGVTGVTSVPEPSTLLLVGTGLWIIGLIRRKEKGTGVLAQ